MPPKKKKGPLRARAKPLLNKPFDIPSRGLTPAELQYLQILAARQRAQASAQAGGNRPLVKVGEQWRPTTKGSWWNNLTVQQQQNMLARWARDTVQGVKADPSVLARQRTLAFKDPNPDGTTKFSFVRNDDAMVWLTSLKGGSPDSELAQWQRKFWDAGLYDNGQASPNYVPRLGYLDPDTMTAFSTFLAEAATIGASARDTVGLSWDELLQQRSQAYQFALNPDNRLQGPGGGGFGGGGGGGGGAATGGTISSEEAIRQMTDVAAQEIIGMRADPGTKERMVAEINRMEEEANIRAATDPNAQINQIDVQAEINRRLREWFGAQTVAHDELAAASVVMDMFLAGPGGGGLSSGFGSKLMGPRGGAPV